MPSQTTAKQPSQQALQKASPARGKRDLARNAVRELVKRVAYRFPNGRVYYETAEGILDYAEGHKEDLEKLARGAQDLLVKVRGNAVPEESRRIGLEGRLALVDDAPRVGDLVVVTEGGTSLYAREGSYGIVQSLSGDGETADVEFYHFTGNDGHDATLPTPQLFDVRMQDIRRAVVLEEGRWEVMYKNPNAGRARDTRDTATKQFQLMRGDRSPLIASSQKTASDEERGLIGTAVKYVLRVTGDHLVATVALAVAVYAVDCGIRSWRESRETQHRASQDSTPHIPAQQMLLFPTITVLPENRVREGDGDADGADRTQGAAQKRPYRVPLSEEGVLREALGR